MADALLTVEHLTKSFGEKLLFDDISFGINAGQKSALIARNGYGKSTLISIIMTSAGAPGYNTLQDAGRITFRGDVRLECLAQSTMSVAERSVRSFVYDVRRPEAEDTWTFEQRIEEIVDRMRLTPLLDRPLHTLSGGEQKKAALCRMLVDDCNLLILDEPTNHLDIGMIEWLEDYLSRRRLALLVVSHDRYFLDHVCQDIYELDNASLYHYKGRYDYYLEKKAEREAAERAEVAKARSLYRTELEWMRRMPQARGTKAQARIDAFYELQAKARTRFDDTRQQLSVKTERIGGKILELYNVCYSMPPDSTTSTPTTVIDDFSYVFKRGEKIGIVGPNGIGKSTLLNIVTGHLKPTSGRVVVGQTIRFGYYSQAGLAAPPDKRVIDILRDIAEEIDVEGGRSLSAHQFLTHFGFDDTTQFNYFSNLSGGERRKLYLLMVLMANPNFLILDEPTNDLDIYTLQVLEEFLQSYKGCLLVVSHDRSFLDHIADHLFVFEGGGIIKDYYSTYTDYRLARQALQRQRQLDERSRKAASPSPSPAQTPSTTRRKATYKEQREYEALAAEIASLTAERADLEGRLAGGGLASQSDIVEASTRIGQLIELLDKKELRWLELDELM